MAPFEHAGQGSNLQPFHTKGMLYPLELPAHYHYKED